MPRVSVAILGALLASTPISSAMGAQPAEQLAAQDQAQNEAAINALPACKANALSAFFDGEDGAFDGMMHSGALLVLRNIGPAPCRIERLPKIVLLGAGDQQPLNTHRDLSDDEHTDKTGSKPARNLGLAPGAEATAALRWVSGDAYGAGNCRSADAAHIMIDGEAIPASIGAHLCAPKDAVVTFSQPPLALDPILVPKKTADGATS